uniref:Uncharacterized protein n=1 Tax=Angiostrongylus cantonensis TaxID=6313 RepID=A0A158P9L9_ANGCA
MDKNKDASGVAIQHEVLAQSDLSTMDVRMERFEEFTHSMRTVEKQENRELMNYTFKGIYLIHNDRRLPVEQPAHRVQFQLCPKRKEKKIERKRREEKKDEKKCETIDENDGLLEEKTWNISCTYGNVLGAEQLAAMNLTLTSERASRNTPTLNPHTTERDLIERNRGPTLIPPQRFPPMHKGNALARLSPRLLEETTRPALYDFHKEEILKQQLEQQAEYSKTVVNDGCKKSE